MEYVTLGKTGLRISRLGLGGIPIQRISGDEAAALIRKLPEYGVNFIDTARSYTVSEEYIGAAICSMRDKFVLATKSQSLTKDAMAKDVDISLKNLRTDYIDLYQFHCVTPERFEAITGPGGALEALLEARAAGKIGHIGITTHEAEIFEKAVECDWVETVMFPYNFVETQGEALIAKCAEKNIGFLSMKPLAGGAIEDVTLAMRFIAANPNVTVNIPGMFNEKELVQNIAASEDHSPLTAAELEKIQKLRDELGTNFCRRCNYCQPCTVGISISAYFTLNGYLTRYGLADWAMSRYDAMAVKPDACVECGLCESRCPYKLPIISMLKDVNANFLSAKQKQN